MHHHALAARHCWEGTLNAKGWFHQPLLKLTQGCTIVNLRISSTNTSDWCELAAWWDNCTTTQVSVYNSCHFIHNFATTWRDSSSPALDICQRSSSLTTLTSQQNMLLQVDHSINAHFCCANCMSIWCIIIHEGLNIHVAVASWPCTVKVNIISQCIQLSLGLVCLLLTLCASHYANTAVCSVCYLGDRKIPGSPKSSRCFY